MVTSAQRRSLESNLNATCGGSADWVVPFIRVTLLMAN
jgi:hypothetical protein